jgi:hypothetical protein
MSFTTATISRGRSSSDKSTRIRWPIGFSPGKKLLREVRRNGIHLGLRPLQRNAWPEPRHDGQEPRGGAHLKVIDGKRSEVIASLVGDTKIGRHDADDRRILAIDENFPA